MNTHVSSSLFSPIEIDLEPLKNEQSPDELGHNVWRIRNQAELLQLVRRVRSNLRADKLRSFLDASIGVAASFISSHSGTAPSFFPVFSHQGFAQEIYPNSIYIDQDHIEPQQLSNFLCFFLMLHRERRPNLRFRYHDRDTSLQLLSKVASVSNVFESFGDSRKLIRLDPEAPSKNEHLSFILDGNLDPASVFDISTDKKFLNGWAAARSGKLFSAPEVARRKIELTMAEVRSQYVKAPSSERTFWVSLIIQLQLDLAYVKDQAPNETMVALALARELDIPELVAHCQRFANQFLGVSPEALAMLDESCKIFDAMPVNSEMSGSFLASKYGAILNKHTTALIASKSQPDVGRMNADYDEAKNLLPTYCNLALLGNAIGVSYLCCNQTTKAIGVFEDALLQNSLPVDRLNICVNLLAAQHIDAGDFEYGFYERTCKEIQELELGESWEYERARMATNLMRIANNREHFELARNIYKESSFWPEQFKNADLDELQNYIMKTRCSHYYVNDRIPGVFGSLSERYKLSLAIDKDWT